MLTELGWLPPAAADFRARTKALRADLSAGRREGVGERIVALGAAALDETQLDQAARLAGEAFASEGEIAGLSRARIGLVGDGTLDLAASAIGGSGLRHGLALEVIPGEYGGAVREAMDPTSPLKSSGLDFLLIAPDARLLGLCEAAGSAEDASHRVGQALDQIVRIAEGFRPRLARGVLVQTLSPPHEPLFGSYDRLEPTSNFAMIEALNRRLAEWAASGAAVVVDIARLAASVGIEHWEDPGHWHASKLPFSPRMLPVYGDVVARTVAAILGKAKKCLVLDLDNTLWGGVIGDDGLSGIALGQGSAAGEAHLAIQRMARELRARGVVLAVCSKNEEDAARSPFREHPEMLLKESDIAVFQANWTDKAANLKAIAEALNIGVDALVFLDDNPAERAQVRQELPLVGVPELPDDPALFPRMLAAAGYFEAVAFSKEDRERAGYYQANAERAKALSATGDMNAYLESLEMTCQIGPSDALTRPRVSQLINKSNQFNLTTRRYSEQEVAAIEADPKRHLIQIRLIDRFGDNGIIGVIIADKGRDAWTLDTWLMSCRVLGRRVEEAALAHLAAAAREERAKALIGRYIPTAKNRMVADHYRKLGFEKVEEGADGATTWRLELSAYTAPEFPMRIEDRALAAPEPA